MSKTRKFAENKGKLKKQGKNNFVEIGGNVGPIQISKKGEEFEICG